MIPQAGVWGIDLGQCGLKALRLQEIDGQLTATAFDYVEHPKILSQPDADPDQLTREALEKFLSRNNLRGDTVAISVPGQSGLARFVKLPPVEEKKIADIVRFEAKQQIPFNLEEVVWDYQKIGAGTVTDGFAMDTEIGLFAMKRDMVSKYLQHFKDVNVEVHVIQMAPLALCNYASFDLLKKDNQPAAEGAEEQTNCVVVLDIGTDSSNLVITDGNRIIWQRPIPLGGNHFTRALTKDLKLTFAKAEHLKRNATKSPDLKKILSSLKPVLNDFVSEVQRSLGYFTNTHRDAQIDHLIGLGNAFRLPGLQRFLEEKLGLSVRKLQKLERLTGDPVVTAQVYTENIMTFAVAYGLALQGMKRTRLLTNLLPAEIRTERLIKAKKPWAAAAAGALLLGLGGLIGAYGVSYRTYNHPDVEAAIKKVDDAKKKAADADSQFSKAKADANKEEEGVKSIVAGQGEFMNWLEFMSFLGKAVPQPDGLNLLAEAKAKYWSLPPDRSKDRPGAMTGAQAYEAFAHWQEELRLAPIPVDTSNTNNINFPGNPGDRNPGGRTLPSLGKPGRGGPSTIPGGPMGGPMRPGNPNAQSGGEAPVVDLGPGIDDRIQVNIEAIDCRYTEDLAAFWRQVQNDKRNSRGDIRPLKQYDQLPDGKGWVVELRGYTFHRDRGRFLVDTFVENLAQRGLADFGAPAKPSAGEPKPADKPDPKEKAGKPDPKEKAGKPDPKAKGGEHLPDKGPVVNLVSHVVLFEVASEKTNDTSHFSLHSNLDKLLGGEGGGGRFGRGAGPSLGSSSAEMMKQGGPSTGSGPNMKQGGKFEGGPGSSSVSRTGWQPLAEGFSQGGGGRPNMGGMMGGTGGNPGMPNERLSQGSPSTPASKTHERTEFIILFIWKEPTPSDALFHQGGTAGTSRPGSGPPPKPSGPGGQGTPSTKPPGGNGPTSQ
jgi:type IV pilus assembly protein PilM